MTSVPSVSTVGVITGGMIRRFANSASRGIFDGVFSSQYRICFRWEEGDAVDVEVTDYH